MVMPKHTVKDTSLTDAALPLVGLRLAVHIISFASLMLTTELACRYQLRAARRRASDRQASSRHITSACM